MGDIYQDMLLGMFDSIIERSSDNVVFYKSWKSNQKHRIGMRLRKSRFILPRFRMGYGGGLDFEDERFLADLDKCWGYLHGISGDYDGLVQAVRKNRIGTGDRYSSRFFEFRYYKGAQTLHFYPKNAEVMDKMNRFVGKLRNWLPGDMDEANADFKKQYEKGETFTDEYMEAYRQSTATRYGLDRPHHQLLRQLKGLDQDGGTPEIDRLHAAIEGVHQSHALHCGPALGAGLSKQVISVEKSQAECTQQHKQLLLLAA